jgi:hypothetical protein
MVDIALEYLIETEQFDYLFTKIKNFFDKNQQTDIFLGTLESFIMDNLIKSIPKNDVFKEIVEYYINKSKLKVVQNLIINLDLKSIDLGFSISLCLDYNLFAPLIYICTRKDNDFITPLNKMY